MYGRKIIIAVIYRPPNATFENDEFMLSAIQTASTNSTLVLFGDFNYSDINWPIQSHSSKTRLSSLFVDNYLNSNLHQLIQQPTRFRNANRPSTLDLLLTNDENLITEINFDSLIGTSDHIVICAHAQFLSYSENRKSPIIRNYWKANYTAINNSLATQDFQFEADDNVDKLWEKISAAVTKITERHVPAKRKSKNTQKPWVTLQLQSQIKHKKLAWNKYTKNRTPENYGCYRMLANQVTNNLRNGRLQYEDNIVGSGASRFYSYMRTRLASKVSSPVVRNAIGEVCTDPADIANIFAEQFYKAYVTEPGGDLPTLPLETRNNNTLSTVEFTPSIVQKHLQNLNSHSSPGLNDLHPHFLKQTCTTLAGPLSAIMTKSIDTSTLPSEWKSSVVTPIYKKGDKLNAENYRPISLTSVVCKTMERIIVDRMIKFLLANSIVSESQHGFMPGRSIATNLLLCLNDWTKLLDRGEPVDIIYLDFEKAFDRVPLERLVYKLEHYGIRGQLLSWISAFLFNRSFHVRVNNCLSDKKSVLSGVPQGSVLGPVLFVIFINDLLDSISSPKSCYADDTKLYNNPVTNYQEIKEDLNRIQQWCDTWMLTLNKSKCVVLHMGFNNPRINYSLEEVPLRPVACHVDLGITITEDLKWESHIINITKKANTLIYLIKKSFVCVSPPLLTKIYKTYVRPILEFGAVIWSPYFIKDISLLENVQRRFTKIPKSLKNLPYDDRLKLLQLPTLTDRRSRGDLIETYKILSGCYTCKSVNDLFQINTESYTRGHYLKLKKDNFKKLSRENFFSVRVCNLWNRLSHNTIDSTGINMFKNRLDAEVKSVSH